MYEGDLFRVASYGEPLKKGAKIKVVITSETYGCCELAK